MYSLGTESNIPFLSESERDNTSSDVENEDLDLFTRNLDFEALIGSHLNVHTDGKFVLCLYGTSLDYN